MHYYIYHIEGVKIGCTKRLQQRMREQKFNQWQVLEIHTDKETAGIRERELQIQYGYKIDSIQYSKYDYSSNGKVGGTIKKTNIDGCRKGGITTGNIKKSNGTMDKLWKASIEKTKKPIIVYDLSNNVIGEYESLHSAARLLNVSVSKICLVLKGLRNKHKGYIFNYK